MRNPTRVIPSPLPPSPVTAILWTQSPFGKRFRAVGGRAVQTQMLLEVRPSVYQQILILPLGQLRPLPDNTGTHWWV